MHNSIFEKERLEAEKQDIPLYQRVQNVILEEIKSGTLKPGAMLPSSRELAEQLGVSRKTIVTALETLVLKGKLESRDRVGVFVAKKSAESGPASPAPKAGESAGGMLRINDGFPDTSLIPFREFSRTYRQLFNRMAQWKMLGYNDPMGYVKLRHVVSDVLGRMAGLSVSVDDICLVRGSQMALFLACNAVLDAGDHVAVETPGYLNAYMAFERAGMTVHEIPVDKDGIDVDRLEVLCGEVELSAVYVTPRHQYPTTVMLSAKRRQKLCDLSLRYGFIVIEDDFGFAYNFSNHRVTSLSSMLPKSHYIYIGTFSKIFAPSMRLGYMASSPEIIRQVADYRTLIDIQGDIIMERALYELYECGHMQKHIRRSALEYKERLAATTREIKRVLGDSVAYKQPHGGLAVWLGLDRCTLDAASVTSLLHDHHIAAPVFDCADGSVGIRIGYASLTRAELTRLLECLRQI